MELARSYTIFGIHVQYSIWWSCTKYFKFTTKTGN